MIRSSAERSSNANCSQKCSEISAVKPTIAADFIKRVTEQAEKTLGKMLNGLVEASKQTTASGFDCSLSTKLPSGYTELPVKIAKINRFYTVACSRK